MVHYIIISTYNFNILFQRILSFPLLVYPVHAFNLKDNFSYHALCKLENAGIPVLTTLARIPQELQVAAQLHAEVHDKLKESHTSELEYVKAVMTHWTAGDSARAPTWKSLLGLLRELHQEALSGRIKDYLHGEAVALNYTYMW